ncbi:MAG: tetratricopeptide repeat protein [Sphingobacteriaceae bacterium]|nr:tetratricopeptide repeat protein [Sphingobacteriaceae bacterium]
MKIKLSILFIRQIILIGVLASLNLQAQNSFRDSLKILLKKSIPDSIRINALNELINDEKDRDLWDIYNEEIIKVCERNLTCENESLKNYYKESLASAYNNKGYMENLAGNNFAALELFKKGVIYSLQVNDSLTAAYSLINIGAGYDIQGNLLKALEQYHLSLTWLEKLKDKRGMAACLINIGNIHKKQNELQTALTYYERSLKLNLELNDSSRIASSYNYLGMINSDLGLMDKAFYYHINALRIRQDVQDLDGLSKSNNNIGFLHKMAKNYDSALYYFNEGLKYAKLVRDKKSISNTLDIIAQAYFEMDKFSEAMLSAQESMKMAKETQSPIVIRNSARTLRFIYLKQKKYKEAYDMFELQIKMKDSLSNDETRKASVKKDMQYQFDKKELTMLAEQDKLNALANEEIRQKKRERVFFSIGLLFMLVIIVLVFISYSQKRKTNKLIVEQKAQVEQKQKEILDSIHYARRIQMAMMPREKNISVTLEKIQTRS